ncbi:hypothetical protein [Streptomyces sp. NPDC002044]|uniref:hypothetical protein n=1 Tax=Streptomyces sp. NPDC002044 TaxID=3154662 RepID=UPI00332266A5
MNSRTRLAVLSPFLVSCVALGPVAVAQAPAAVPAGSCTVKPSDDGVTVTVTGVDFIGTGGAGLRGDDGGFIGIGNLDGVAPPGFFVRTGLPPGEYLVQQQKGPVVKCKAVGSDKATNSKSVREARQQGFSAGVKAGKQAAQEDCDSKPKPHKKPGLTAQDAAVEAAFEQGFLAGAQSAFAKFCRT